MKSQHTGEALGALATAPGASRWWRRATASPAPAGSAATFEAVLRRVRRVPALHLEPGGVGGHAARPGIWTSAGSTGSRGVRLHLRRHNVDPFERCGPTSYGGVRALLNSLVWHGRARAVPTEARPLQRRKQGGRRVPGGRGIDAVTPRRTPPSDDLPVGQERSVAPFVLAGEPGREHGPIGADFLSGDRPARPDPQRADPRQPAAAADRGPGGTGRAAARQPSRRRIDPDGGRRRMTHRQGL